MGFHVAWTGFPCCFCIAEFNVASCIKHLWRTVLPQAGRKEGETEWWEVRAPQADQVRHGEDMEGRARDHRAAWEVAVAEKTRLARMRDHEASFRDAIVARRTEEFEALRVRPASLVRPLCSRGNLGNDGQTPCI